MLSVNNMLNNQVHNQHNNKAIDMYKRPDVLNISNLLCTKDNIPNKSPSLSPSLTSSPASVSSYSYPFNNNESYPYAYPESTPLWEEGRYSNYPTYPISTVSSIDNSYLLDEDMDELDDEDDEDSHTIKAKRRRANAKQLEVLNRVFDRTFFPSTQMRAELGRQLGMSPRTVQIWFQNRRQAMRTRERQRLIKLRNETK
ncbi:hypothetical protein BDB01DRAFT_802746 [Pilobolus umbonatus]|nr:hypothetical protein BDB01DRAFT_802746 [Pilobolus umbonatus]